ncbi:MAG: peptide deformylase [Bacteroidetes bacterium]|nr:peptide deformylase [Bacteroidota bacterium]MBL6944073.1 peptide deformylase [Bacteroidales bacterium]
MILPIAAYGHQTLKQVGEEIRNDYENLDTLIEDMFETMYASNGVGLAAHQINRAIRLFVIDASPLSDNNPEFEEFKRKIFINAYITKEEGEDTEFEEGCLSIPGITELVKKKPVIYLSYYDEDFNFHENERFDGILSRIIQHEYDHINGKLFIERIPNFRRLLLKGKLRDISNGDADVAYRMILPKKRTRK